MSDFTFTSTAECGDCGALLSSSDEDCDHNGKDVKEHVFRHVSNRSISEGKRNYATMDYKWEAFEQGIGESWMEYEWLGTKEHVMSLLQSDSYEGFEDLPREEFPTERPID